MGTSHCWNCRAEVDDAESHCPNCRTNLDGDGAPVLDSDKPSAAARLLKKTLLSVSVAAVAGGIYFLVETDRILPLLRTVQREAALLEPVKVEGPTKIENETKPPPVKEKAWRVHGRIFDLITLEPIGGADISFRGKSSRRTLGARTDHQGFYSALLPKSESEGYAVSVSHPKYGTIFSEDRTPSYGAKSLEKRKEAREMIRSLTQWHVPVLPPQEDDDYELDIVMSLP